jgi:hypothetical protein
MAYPKGHKVLIVLSATACAMAIAACGSSSKPRSSASSSYPQNIKYADCMRSHGVPNFPDPTTSGGGINIKKSSGINLASPAFESAQASCVALLPGDGPLFENSHTAATEKQWLAIAECMRAHGVSDFPDPKTPPPINPTGYAAVAIENGVAFAFPTTIDAQSPAVRQAATRCKAPLPPGG